MANLITGIDWFDHGRIPRREPSEPAKENGEGASSATEDQDEERVPLDQRCWWLREARKRFKPFWWADGKVAGGLVAAGTGRTNPEGR